MAETEISRQSTLRFALPIVAEYILMSLIAAVNLALVGHLGPAALSAVGLSSQPVAISLALFQSISVGATALVARAVGAGDHHAAEAVVYQALYIAVGAGLIAGVGAFTFAERIVLGMGAKPETLQSATLYMRFMAVGKLFQAVPTTVTAGLRGAGNSTGPMWYNILTNLVNAVLGLVLIHGVWGFPAWGLLGAAVATTVAKIFNTWAALTVLRRVLRHGGAPGSLRLRALPPPDRALTRRILMVGNSAAVESLAMRAGFVFYSRIIADLGTVQFAAHQIILSATQFGSNTVQGLSAAASSYTGRALGAREPATALRRNRILLEFGLLTSLALGVLFWGWGAVVARWFTRDPQTVRLAAQILRIAAIITIPQSLLAILSGALRGAGDTKWPMYGAFAGVILARVGLAFILVVRFGMGLHGAWLAALADQTIRALFTTVRYARGKWIALRV